MWFAGALALATCAGCSVAGDSPDQEPTNRIPGFAAASRLSVDGVLIDTGGGGGRLGVLDVEQGATGSKRIYAETILLQRQPPPPPGLPSVDAISQVVEIDCDSGQSRTVANLAYRRDGALLTSTPVAVPFSDGPYGQEVVLSLCDGSYRDDPVSRFDSIGSFLDLFEAYPAPPLGPPELSP